jgi:predicted ester cyclase
MAANASVESVWERRTISMAAQDNKEKARRLYEEAFGQGKTEVLDPNFVCWDPNAEGGEVRGLETVKGEVEYFHQGFPEDFFWRVEDQVVEGDKVTTRYTMGGTHQGEFFGVSATGRRGEISGINIDRFDESGKVVEEWASYDLLGAMRRAERRGIMCSKYLEGS